MREVAVIIPAFNEEHRIQTVLQAVLQAKQVTQIIVVNDGSSDGTAAAASRVEGITVIDLKVNLGKGGAMAAGVRSTTAPYIAFVDADLAGLKGEHVDAIIRPVVSGEYDMCVGVFRGGKIGSNASMTVTPFLSGQRAMRREIFEAIPYIGELRYGVEMALTQSAKRKRSRVLRVILRGVSNCYKEEKMGLVKGLAARTKMYKEITEAMVRSHKKRVRPKRWPKI